MSYILDALRRADAERERGRVPGIHAHGAPSGADDAAVRSGAVPWRWIALGVVLGLLAVVLLWWLLGRDRPPETPPAAMAPPPIPRDGMRPLEPPRPGEGPPPPGRPNESPGGEMRPGERSGVAPRPPEGALPPIEQKPTSEALAAAAARKAAQAASSAVPAAAPPAPAAAASAAAPRLYARHELPEDIRRQLPNVTISGSMWSPTAANRFVVANGQVVHEGAEIAPELVLETIKLKSAVLRFKGYRYETTF